MSMRSFLLMFMAAAMSVGASAADILSHWEVGMRGGYAFDSNHVLMDRLEPDGTVTHSAMSWHVKYAFSRPGTGRTSSVFQGVGLGVTTFLQGRQTGTPVGLYTFQGAPVAVFSERFSLDYEWNFGATFGWKRTTRDDDIRSNLVVGSSTNAYLNLGIKANYALATGINVTAGLDMSHYSNGNTSWPNPGVNTIGASLGLVYTSGEPPLRRTSPFTSDADFSPGIVYDIMAYGAWRKAYFPYGDGAFTEAGEKALLPGKFGVAGITFAPMWKVHSTFRTGLSADIQWSENSGLTSYHIPDTYGEDAKFTRPPFYRQLSAGLSARAELVMPIFSLNVGIGYGIAGPRETRKLYQLVCLKAYIHGPVYLNIGYRLYQFRSPSNLMLGFGITL